MPQNIVSVVLVTNAGQGYGRAIALAYGLADFDVICADKDVGLASKTAAEIEELGGNAIPVQANVSVQADIQKVFERAYDIFGDLSGVVHVASFDNPNPFERLTEGEFNDLWIGNLKSTFLLLRQTQRYLSEGWFVLVGLPYHHDGLHIEAIRGALGNLINQAEKSYPHLNSNMVIPSRQASDPYHDAALVDSVRFLGADNHGISGQRIYVDLPPPPKIIESLLPEVRAALNGSVRQNDMNDITDLLELAPDASVDNDAIAAQQSEVTFLESYIDDDYDSDNDYDAYADNGYVDDSYNDDSYHDDAAEKYAPHDSSLVMNVGTIHHNYNEGYTNDDYTDDDYTDGYEKENWHDADDDALWPEHETTVTSWQEEAQLAEAMKAHTSFPVVLDDSQLEPLNFEDTAAQLEAALADDPDNHWYRKERQHNSTPASRAARKNRPKR